MQFSTVNRLFHVLYITTVSFDLFHGGWCNDGSYPIQCSPRKPLRVGRVGITRYLLHDQVQDRWSSQTHDQDFSTCFQSVGLASGSKLRVPLVNFLSTSICECKYFLLGIRTGETGCSVKLICWCYLHATSHQSTCFIMVEEVGWFLISLHAILLLCVIFSFSWLCKHFAYLVSSLKGSFLQYFSWPRQF